MQIIIISLRVIFMLSTIVYATDCCSSRILLLKEQASKRQRAEKQALLAPSQNPHSLPTASTTTTANCSTQQQRRDAMINIAREYNKRFSGRYHGVLKDEDNIFSDSEEEKSSLRRNEDITDDIDAPRTQLMMEKTTSLLKNDSEGTSRINFNKNHVNHQPLQDFIIDPDVREKHAGNPKYHTIDLYYKIMRDVLSYECLGNFLTDFCLNGGRCFRYPIANHSFYSCECADGFVGERCESKALINELRFPATISVSRHGLPPQPKILMARLFFTFPALIVLTMIYILIAIYFVIQHPKKQNARHNLPDYM